MKKLLTVIVIVLVTGSLIFAVLSFLGRDNADTYIQDDDLQIKRLNLPPESNACTYFLAATNSLHMPSDVYCKVTESIKSNVWDEAVVTGILSTNEATLAILENGLKRSSCECPMMTNTMQSLSYISSWRSMARVMSLKTKWLFRSGRQDEAFENAVKTVKFGNMVQDGSENLITWLVGLAIKGIGLENLEEMIGPCTISSDKLKTYAEILAGYNAAETGLQKAFKGEYRYACMIIDEVRKGKTTLTDLLAFGIGRDHKNRFSFHVPSYMLDPERTKIIFADSYRDYIKATSQSYNAINQRLIERDDASPFGIKQLFLPNGLGKYFHGFMISCEGRTLEKKCRDDAGVAGISVLLALKAFQMDSNRLPESLTELVPSCLKKIPDDPYDGKPVRYSRESKKVYFVGRDLKDSGGSEANLPSAWSSNTCTNRWNTEDAVYGIKF